MGASVIRSYRDIVIIAYAIIRVSARLCPTCGRKNERVFILRCFVLDLRHSSTSRLFTLYVRAIQRRVVKFRTTRARFNHPFYCSENTASDRDKVPPPRAVSRLSLSLPREALRSLSHSHGDDRPTMGKSQVGKRVEKVGKTTLSELCQTRFEPCLLPPPLRAARARERKRVRSSSRAIVEG